MIERDTELVICKEFPNMELIQKFLEACRQRNVREIIFLGCEIVATYGRMLVPAQADLPEPYMSFSENSEDELYAKLQSAGEKAESQKESIDTATVFTIVNVILELLSRFRRSR